MNHFAVSTPTAWAVAYDRGDGQAVAVCECADEASARREAHRLNALDRFECQARQRAAIRHDLRQGRGRHVRYFEPDIHA